MRILEWRLFRARRGLGTQSPGPCPGLSNGCAFGAWIRPRDQGGGITRFATVESRRTAGALPVSALAVGILESNVIQPGST